MTIIYIRSIVIKCARKNYRHKLSKLHIILNVLFCLISINISLIRINKNKLSAHYHTTLIEISTDFRKKIITDYLDDKT